VRQFLKPAKWLVVVITALAIDGFAYEQLERRDYARVPQIGRSIDIGGRSLNMYCSGEGSPTVIFDSGRGMPGYSWILVQPEVAKLTRACWYDRAGYGWSDPAPAAQRSDAIAKDLHQLLHVGGVPPPYVLVGHSFGGLNVRVYSGFYPAEVAGMVLVDPIYEEMGKIPYLVELAKRGASLQLVPLRLPESFFPAKLLFAQMLGQVGVFRLVGSSHELPARGITPEEWAMLSTLGDQSKAYVAAIREGPRKADFEILRHTGSLRNLPFVVLTAGRPPTASDSEEVREFQRAWIEMHGELARKSTRGRQVVVTDSGHMIPYEAPESVIDAVRNVVAEVREEVRESEVPSTKYQVREDRLGQRQGN
jgi:pimeloyl-ACP methyl ester carboxylesterase